MTEPSANDLHTKMMVLITPDGKARLSKIHLVCDGTGI
jgi:hypothetical protein